MTELIQARARRAIERVGVHTDNVELRRQLLDALRPVLGFDFAVLSTVDPATVLWSNCVLYGIDEDPQRHAAIFANEYREDDLHKVSDIALWPRPVATLSSVTAEARRHSPRAGMLSQMGIADELRCALVYDDLCWGSLVAYRTDGEFGEGVVETASEIGERLADLIRMSLLFHAARNAPEMEHAPGVVLVNRDGSLSPVTKVSERWLTALRVDEATPSALVAHAARFESTGEPATAVVPDGTGRWVRLHAAHPATEADHIVVVIEPVRPIELAGVLAQAYGLTPRERTVTAEVARGHRSKEIADRLDISGWTVNDHLKSIFTKVGVTSRQELLAELFFNHVLPRREQGLAPGPYGWFLE